MHELRGVVTLCQSRVSGDDPSMSMLLGLGAKLGMCECACIPCYSFTHSLNHYCSHQETPSHLTLHPWMLRNACVLSRMCAGLVSFFAHSFLPLHIRSIREDMDAFRNAITDQYARGILCFVVFYCSQTELGFIHRPQPRSLCCAVIVLLA